MDSFATVFELVVLLLTGLSVLALVAFIWMDAAADRRLLLAARTRQALLNVQSVPQAVRQAAGRRSKTGPEANPKAA